MANKLIKTAMLTSFRPLMFCILEVFQVRQKTAKQQDKCGRGIEQRLVQSDPERAVYWPRLQIPRSED